MDPGKYSDAFYQHFQDGSSSSAQVVAPIVLSLFPCRSVVDVGCGVGSWLKEFERSGISDYLGVDGDHVAPHLLKIPLDRFRPVDLENVTDLGRRFDLVCCLEVAEHLREARADSFIALLVKTAPVVLFSAAIPHQGGVHHVNEQRQSYWAELFARHGYIALDCIRPVIYGDSRVEYWYRQNIILYCEPDRRPPGCREAARGYDLDRIDPGTVGVLIDRIAALEGRPRGGREAWEALLRSASLLTNAAVDRTIGSVTRRLGRVRTME